MRSPFLGHYFWDIDSLALYDFTTHPDSFSIAITVLLILMNLRTYLTTALYSNFEPFCNIKNPPEMTLQTFRLSHW